MAEPVDFVDAEVIKSRLESYRGEALDRDNRPA